MSNVREIAPANLANIPAMLRHWAAELESGREPMPKSALLILVEDGETPPTVCAFGKELSRLEEIGALATCVNQAMAVHAVPDHG